jgi:alkyl hydroperoxide reductase subunit D
MNVVARPGVEKSTFVLWSLAVSVINEGGGCLESHQRAVRRYGLTVAHVLASVRIAVVVRAVVTTLDVGQEPFAQMARAWGT